MASSNHDAQLKDMLERIVKKVENSPVLNGGWDKMVLTMEHIKEKQDDTSEKVDNIHQALYEPDNGLFARVKTIEHTAEVIEKEVETNARNDEELQKQLQKAADEGKPAIDMAAKMETIAGKDLQDLKEAIKVQKTMNKIFWMIAAGSGSLVVKVVYDFLAAYLHISGGH
jgi:seryl-tRNA synthetase